MEFTIAMRMLRAVIVAVIISQVTVLAVPIPFHPRNAESIPISQGPPAATTSISNAGGLQQSGFGSFGISAAVASAPSSQISVPSSLAIQTAPENNVAPSAIPLGQNSAANADFGAAANGLSSAFPSQPVVSPVLPLSTPLANTQSNVDSIPPPGASGLAASTLLPLSSHTVAPLQSETAQATVTNNILSSVPPPFIYPSQMVAATPDLPLQSLIQMAMAAQASANPSAPKPQIIQPIVIVVAPPTNAADEYDDEDEDEDWDNGSEAEKPFQAPRPFPASTLATTSNQTTGISSTTTKANATEEGPFKLSLIRTTLIDNIFFKGSHINEVQPETGMSRAAILCKEVGQRFLPLKDPGQWKGKLFLKSLGEGIKAFFQSIPALFEVVIRQGH